MLKKTEKVKKTNKKIKKVESTQLNVPVKDIINGIIITNDNRYVKIIEINPSPLLSKSIEEKNRILRRMQEVLNTTTTVCQMKSIALPANITKIMDEIEKNRESEISDSCVDISYDYEDRLIKSQAYSVTRRFFFIISHKSMPGLFTKNVDDFDEISYNLNSTAEQISSILRSCDNDIIEEGYRVDELNPNTHAAEILYTLLNRSKAQNVSFEKNLNEVVDRYVEQKGSTDIYIPPTEYLAPSNISYTGSRVKVDNTFYGFLFISMNGYPDHTAIGWLNPFVSSDVGVDVDVFLRKYDTDDKMSQLRINSVQSGADMRLAEGPGTSAYVAAQRAKSASDFLLAGLNKKEEFFYVNTIITVSANSAQALNKKIKNVIKIAKRNKIKLYEFTAQAEDAFKSVLPLCSLDNDIFEKTKRNLLTSAAATFYLYTVFQLNEPEGIYFGDSLRGYLMYIINVFNRQRFNSSNVFCAGETGSGKTYTLLLLALRARIMHIPIIIIAPDKQHEFARAAMAVGGTVCFLGPGHKNVVNIMEIFKRDETGQAVAMMIDGAEHEDKSLLLDKVKTIIKFFKDIIPDMNLEESQALDTAIVKTFNNFGITEDNDTLWEDARKTKFKKMPILSDLRETIYELDAPKRIKVASDYLTSGSMSCFNGETNIDLNNEFVVFGLQDCDDETDSALLALSMHMVMSFVWNKIKEDRTKRKFIFIDEWWKLAGYPIAAKETEKIARLIRAYSGGLWIFTQRMRDVYKADNGEAGEAVIGCCPIKILLRSQKTDLDETRKMIEVTDDEALKLLDYKRGTGLFLAGNNRMEIKFVASRSEHELITTDREEQLEIFNRKAKEKELEEERIRRENAKPLDSLLANLGDVKELKLMSFEESERHEKKKKSIDILVSFDDDTRKEDA